MVDKNLMMFELSEMLKTLDGLQLRLKSFQEWYDQQIADADPCVVQRLQGADHSNRGSERKPAQKGNDMEMVVIYQGEDACQQCNGWKRVDDGDGQSWQYWEELPAQSRIAVTMGIVKPIECPRCGGSGKEPDAG